MNIAANLLQDISITTEDGLHLEVDLYPAPQPCCILAHGSAYNKDVWKMLASSLQCWGWMALALNFRGYGQSGGIGPHYERDILACLDYARSLTSGPIVLLGASMGGGAVLHALAQSTEAVDGVILLSPAGGVEHLPALKGKARLGLLLFSNEEAYVSIAQGIAAHPPFPLWVQSWDGQRHAHKLLDDPLTGPELYSAIGTFLSKLRLR